jgi:hypothetical protein
MKTKRKDFATLSNYLEKCDNTICLGFTHHLYGPLRGCNFMIKVNEIEELTDYLAPESFNVTNENDFAKVLEKINGGGTPSNLKELCIKFWTKTGLQVDMQILPKEIFEKAENPPKLVKSFEEGHKEILFQLQVAESLKDPFFFRLGIV